MNSTVAAFASKLKHENISFKRRPISQLQINLGKLCNQVCTHCHVDAGPHKLKENMDNKTALRIIETVKNTPSIKTIDLTGGAPELNSNFRILVKAFKSMGKEVIDRCNLTVLFEKKQADLIDFLAGHQVHIVASLPCYSKENVDSQRGDGVFEKSIRALRSLNEYGYGKNNTHQLDLVYNPGGAFLPGDQAKLEQDYKKLLKHEFDIEFNHLFTITNMPIKRFKYDLIKSRKYSSYMTLLEKNFNKEAAANVMCLDLLSIGWDGQIYDCDFNQMLALPIAAAKKDIWNMDSFNDFHSMQIQTANHCYGCTAGAGSSCGGSLV